ncbi:MAG: hypothetical protein V4857_29510 [Pseudomonadota bacterium]
MTTRVNGSTYGGKYGGKYGGVPRPNRAHAQMYLAGLHVPGMVVHLAGRAK